MEIIEWANKDGKTLVVSTKEAEDLYDAVKDALRRGHGEAGNLEVDVSPILDKED